jgi:hypothetical protein
VCVIVCLVLIGLAGWRAAWHFFGGAGSRVLLLAPVVHARYFCGCFQALVFIATVVALVFTTTTSPGYHVYFVRWKMALEEGAQKTYEVETRDEWWRWFDKHVLWHDLTPSRRELQGISLPVEYNGAPLALCRPAGCMTL